MNDRDINDLSLKIYLINLDRATERLISMQEKLAAVRLPFERVSAVDGATLIFPNTEFSERAFRLLHGRRRNPAEVGCYLSHIDCAKRLLASKAEFALILEDDLEFPADMEQIVRTAIASKADWDILRLSTVNRGRKYPFAKLTPQRSLAIALTREKGSGAYLINRRAATWFVEELMPMRLPFDLAFDLEHLAGLKAAFVHPVPVRQDIGLPSQIQGKRRSYHLPRWKYPTVQPYRAWLEASRFACRLTRLLTSVVEARFAPDSRKAPHREIAGPLSVMSDQGGD
ncbi:MAG: glycosyltransferase family 25 protein [Rhizobiaceae bacterium]|nr:glycosyltransferase family 25 protein [Rhizobiaceae bacterium]